MALDVLHLVWDGHLGGVQRYLQKLLTSPSWKEVSHSVCFFSESGQVLSESSIDGIPCYALGLTNGMQLLRSWKLQSIVNTVDPNVIHCHCDTPAFGLQISRYSNRKLIFHEHGDTLMRTNRRGLTHGLWCYTRFFWDAVILNSMFTYKDFLQHFPWLEQRCHVIHNPLIENCFGEISRKNLSDKPTIGVFARHVPQKGLDWMLAAAKRVLCAVPNSQILIYGEGPLTEGLKKERDALGLTRSVQFMGYVSDPVQEMSRLHAVAIPSKIEPFGLVALEAQSVGVPVVCFDSSGAAEAVIPDKTGYVVHYGDLDLFAEKLVDLLTNEALNREMGIEGMLHVREAFSLEGHIEALKLIYYGAPPIRIPVKEPALASNFP